MIDYLTRYVEERGIPMPYYTNGGKIVEEAYELQEAVMSGSREERMAEVADVIITALVVCHQFDFSPEEALEFKIAKDKGRGLKKGDTNHEEQP